MTDDRDLYETDAAYVEAWERWVTLHKPARKIGVTASLYHIPAITPEQLEAYVSGNVELDL